jgi:hypothetical protein
VVIPAVRLPSGSGVRTPIDIKLKPKWHFDTNRRVFVSESGEEFTPRGQLPKNSRIVYKVPSLVGTDPARLSKSEKGLQRYMHVILPPSESPAQYVDVVRGWPPVAAAQVAPEISLPSKA